MEDECFKISQSVMGVARFPKKNPFDSILAFIIPFTVTHHVGKITLEEKGERGGGGGTVFVWRPKQLGNLTRAVKAATHNIKMLNENRLSWETVVRRLGGLATCSKNTDCRLSYRYENTYIVKFLFTFGQRTVRPETIHVVQTTAAPLIYYQLKSECIAYATLKDGCLIAEEERFYKRHVLQPNSTFAVPPGSTYVLLAYQKTIFAMDVISGSLPPKLSKSPTDNVEWPPGLCFRQQQQLGGNEDNDVVVSNSSSSSSSSSGTKAAAAAAAAADVVVDRGEKSQTTDDRASFMREKSSKSSSGSRGRRPHIVRVSPQPSIERRSSCKTTPSSSSAAAAAAIVVQNPVDLSNDHRLSSVEETKDQKTTTTAAENSSVVKADDLRVAPREYLFETIDFTQLYTADYMMPDMENVEMSFDT